MTRKQKSRQNKRDFARVIAADKGVRVKKGRPSKFDADVADEILDLVSCGATLRAACRELGVDEATVRGWIRNDLGGNAQAKPEPLPGLFTRYARARELQSEAWADDLIEIADRSSTVTVQKARLRSENRKWLMGKNHIRYSDKITVEGGAADRPIVTITRTMTPKEAQEAYADQVKRTRPF